MLFDVRWFVVEAGKPVQVILTNADAMPHNIVIGQPGSVNDDRRPQPRRCRRRPISTPAAYVPDIPLVLQATRLVQRGESDTIKFTAPTTPGEYNFVVLVPGPLGADVRGDAGGARASINSRPSRRRRPIHFQGSRLIHSGRRRRNSDRHSPSR